jgi:hypothetical protein
MSVHKTVVLSTFIPVDNKVTELSLLLILIPLESMTVECAPFVALIEPSPIEILKPDSGEVAKKLKELIYYLIIFKCKPYRNMIKIIGWSLYYMKDYKDHT